MNSMPGLQLSVTHHVTLAAIVQMFATVFILDRGINSACSKMTEQGLTKSSGIERDHVMR